MSATEANCREYAEQLDAKIRAAAMRPESDWDMPSLTGFADLVEEAEDLGIHIQLGYESWEAYRDDATREYPCPTIESIWDGTTLRSATEGQPLREASPEYLARHGFITE